MDSPRSPLPLLALLAVAITLAFAATAAVAAPARADDSPAVRWPANGSTLRLAMGMATERWGMSPCRGRVALSWASLGSATNAQSSWAAAGENPFAQPSSNTGCEIAFSLQAGWDWAKLCTVAIHEVGHLTGHDHVDDSDDVMYVAYLTPAPECASTPEPAEAGPPPPATTTARPAPVAEKAAKRKKVAARRPGRRPAHR